MFRTKEYLFVSVVAIIFFYFQLITNGTVLECLTELLIVIYVPSCFNLVEMMFFLILEYLSSRMLFCMLCTHQPADTDTNEWSK